MATQVLLVPTKTSSSATADALPMEDDGGCCGNSWDADKVFSIDSPKLVELLDRRLGFIYYTALIAIFM